MNLFHTDPAANLLPYDGEVRYYGSILSPGQANHYLQTLLHTIAWKNDEAFIFGKRIITQRKAAWYGDAGYAYTYSNTTKKAMSWTKELLELKQLAESLTGSLFNACLLNLYHSGNEGMGWHSDDEASLSKNAAIASLSLGAERRFAFKHKQSKQAVPVILQHGSLLVMQGPTQSHWLHALPKTTRVTTQRINLTFRTMAV